MIDLEVLAVDGVILLTPELLDAICCVCGTEPAGRVQPNTWYPPNMVVHERCREALSAHSEAALRNVDVSGGMYR